MMCKLHANQRGFSLVELMIALALGIFLILGVTQVFVDSRRTYTVQEALAQMQENARIVMNIMANDLRLAGYLGCGNLSFYEDISNLTQGQIDSYIGPVINIEAGSLAYTAAGAITAYQSTGAQTWHTALPAAIANNGSGYSLADHSDVVTLAGGAGCSAKVASEMAAKSDDIALVSNTCDFVENRIVAVGNCASVDIIKLGDGSSSTLLTHAEDLSHKYSNTYSTTDADIEPSEAFLIENVTYFIATEDDANFPSLYMYSDAFDGDAVALIDGVESLQVAFGIGGTVANGTENIAQSYVDADALTEDMKTKIITARLTLLLRSRGNVVDSDEFDFDSGGTELTFEDGILRKSFTMTVRLRNRQITEI